MSFSYNHKNLHCSDYIKQHPHLPHCQYHNNHYSAFHHHSYHLGFPHCHPHKGPAHSSPIKWKKISSAKTLEKYLKLGFEQDILQLPSELTQNACCLHSQPPFSVDFSPKDDLLLLHCSPWRKEAHNLMAAWQTSIKCEISLILFSTVE